MDNLEKKIQSWRDNFTQSNAFTQSNIDELEDHLRTTVESMQSIGLNDDEVFQIATGRLGTPTKLHQEFAQINRHLIWNQRVQWMIAGVLLFQLVMAGWQALTTGIGLTTIILTQSQTTVAIMTAVLSLGLMLFFWLIIKRLVSEDSRMAKGVAKVNSRVLERPTVTLLLLLPIFIILLNANSGVRLAASVWGGISAYQFGQFAIIEAITSMIVIVLLQLLGVIAIIRLRHYEKRQVV